MDTTSPGQNRIGEMLDKQDIHDLVMRYARGIDRLDFDLVRSCYHEDATDVHSIYQGGIDGFIEYLDRNLRPFECTTHFMGNQLVEVKGEIALGETYAVAYHRRRNDDGTKVDTIIGVRYCDRFERRKGEWRIAHRVVVYDWRRTDPVVGSDEPYAFVTGKHSTDDYIYELTRA